jgi:hypothetical protein
MPYIPKWDRLLAEAREEWMTLAEATHYIREKESCESHVALHQLFLAIVDEEVQVKRGVLHPEVTRKGPPSEFRGDLKICLEGDGSVQIDPGDKKSRLNITIVSASDFRSNDDWAGDDTAGEDPFDYEPLWLCRADVIRLWSGDIYPTINHQARSAKSRKQRVSNEAIRREARRIYKKFSDNPPNIRVAEKLIRERLPGATRMQIEPILKEDEFVRLRRRPGRQP